MRFYLSLTLLFLSYSIFCQEFNITGKVTDEEGTPLEAATVYLEKIADSSLVTYTISEQSGDFQLKGRTSEQKANLIISFAGFRQYQNTIELKNEIKLEPIIMTIRDNTLDEVMITASSPPITLKKDTLEFNAGSFKTRPNANLEELMKQLPGVEIDSEGNITINGVPASRILVNGEEFFGDDPQIALKNLPKEIINKIQITDTKNETQEFTGEDGDPENKTVNITIKEDKNKGYFARATAGGGTNERYELSGIINYFNEEFRTSVLGSSNNINSSGFSYDEVFGMMGRSAVRNDGGNGITKSESAGANITNEWNNKWGLEAVELSGDYFFGRNDTERRSASQTEYLIPESRYFRSSDQGSNLVNDSHRANAEFEIEFDTLTRLSFEPRLRANFGKSYRNRNTESRDENQNIINNTETLENESLDRRDFSNEIDFIRRFGSRGSFLSLEFSNDHERQKNDNFFYSESNFFQEEDERTEIQDQYIDEDEKQDQYAFEVRQRSLLSDQFFLDIEYDLDYSHSTNKRYVYESSNNDGNYNNLNDLLSNDFEVTSRRHTPSLGVNFDNDLWRINADAGVLRTELDNNNFLEGTSFENEYTNLFVDARIRYEREGSGRFSIRYETEADVPSIRQLQPVVDRSDPLDIEVGNPELKPTYSQDIDIRYRNYDYATRTGISSWFSVNFIENDVVSVTTIDEDLARFTTFTNVNGSMDAYAGVSYSKQIDMETSEFRYRLRVNGSYDKNIGFTNAVKYMSERYSLTPRIRFTYTMDDLIEINPEYQLSYRRSTYDIDPDREEEFTDHRAGLELTTYWPEDVIFGNDISYRYQENVAPGFNNSSVLWNMSLGYKFLEDDAALNIKIYDLLDQNIDTRRIIGDDYIRDTSSLILRRYAMLSFTYNLNNIGGRSPDNR